MRRLTARCKGGERGSVAIVVAILLPLVLLGMAALTVDVGTISAERRQLQNSADAVALATAKECAETGSCPSSEDAALVALANGNAQDHRTRIAKELDGPALCGQDANGTLPPCAPLTDSYGDCPAGGDTTGNYVRAYTATESGDGSTILPYFFAQAIVKDGSKGTSQQTCAAAAWGTPASITTTIPFTVGLCEWGRDTGSSDTGEGATFPGPEIAISLNEGPGKSDCKLKNGHNYPGGFGWLANDTCTATIQIGDLVEGLSGVGKAHECKEEIKDAVGHVVYFPVFDSLAGKQGPYHIYGLAAFYLTGYDLPSADKNYDPVEAQPTCAPGPRVKPKHAFSGCFVKGIIPVGSIDHSGSAPDLGLNVIQMVG